jgi:transcriptional regulator
METKTFKVLEMLKKGMKQVDIAAELHVSQPYISTIKKKYKITI